MPKTEPKAPEQRTATVPVADVQTEGKKLTGFAALTGSSPETSAASPRRLRRARSPTCSPATRTSI
jgi:hypothetical protein